MKMIIIIIVINIITLFYYFNNENQTSAYPAIRMYRLLSTAVSSMFRHPFPGSQQKRIAKQKGVG